MTCPLWRKNALTIPQLADRFELSEDYVKRIIRHHQKWGEFA